MRSVSLLRSSPASRISVTPSAWLASTAMIGQLVDGSYGERPGDRDAVQPCPAHLDVGDGLNPPGRIALLHAHRRSHRLQHRENAGAPGVDANARAAHPPARAGRREREEEGGRAEITGDSQPEGFELPRVDGHLAALGHHLGAAHGEHSLGVIPGGHRFDDGGRPVPREPGEQDRRLHLRARHRRSPGQSLERPPALDVERRGPGRRGVDRARPWHAADRRRAASGAGAASRHRRGSRRTRCRRAPPRADAWSCRSCRSRARRRGCAG